MKDLTGLDKGALAQFSQRYVQPHFNAGYRHMTHQAVSVLFLAKTKKGIDNRYELGIFLICGKMILFCNSAEKYTLVMHLYIF